MIASCLFSANKPSYDDLIGIFVSFIGIVILAESKTASNVEVLLDEKESHFLAGFIFAVFTMFALAILAIARRYLKSIHFSIISLHYAFGGTIMSIVAMFFESKP